MRSALDAAHAKGIIHRDLKPDNVKVTSEGGAAPRWREDGRELYYLSLSNTLMVVPVAVDGHPGNPRPLFVANRWANFDVLDNGARFVAIVRESVGYEQPLTILVNGSE